MVETAAHLTDHVIPRLPVRAVGVVRAETPALFPANDSAGRLLNLRKRPSVGPEAEWLLWVCAVQRRRFPVGANPTRRNAPAGSNRSSHGGNEMAEAFG
jgi:hypothetical protein